VLSDILYRIRAVFRRDDVEHELDDELRFHLDREIDKLIASGLSREDATRRARLAFGGLDQTREACRDARGIAPLETLVQDLQYGARTMRRAPLFSITAILTLALSTAALATVFTLGYTLFMRRLPVERPDELVGVAATRGAATPDGLSIRDASRLLALGPVSYPDYVTFRDHATTVTALAAHYPTAPLFVSVNERVKEVNGAVVSASFFPVLGLRPALGRFFRDDEDRVPDRDRVAVLGHSFWRAWFAASPAAIGSTVRINGTDFTIVGVAPPAFVGVTSSPIELYIPTMMLRVGYRWCDDALAVDCTVLQMIGRLAPGRTLADAAAEMPTLMPEAWRRAPNGENSGVIVASPLGASLDGGQDEERLVRILAGVAIVLLLVCCANLAGLVSAQSASRAGEFRIRLSLGASSGRVVRQLLTESLMLAVTGGIAGVGLSRVFIGVLSAMFYAMDDEGHPTFYDFSLTPAVVVVAIAAAVMAGCLFTIVPALRVACRCGLDALHSRSVTARWSSGRWLLGAQAAVAVALVVVGGLIAASARVMVAGKNFDASHVALMRLRPRLVKYSPDLAQGFQRQVIERLATLPGVESVSMVGTGAVLGGGRAFVALPTWTDGQRLRVNANEIGPKYFATLRTPLVAGREFDDRDSSQAPRVAVVNATLASRLWPDGRAIGTTLTVRGQPHQIVGVVEDVTAEKPHRSGRTVGLRPILAESDDDRLETGGAGRGRAGRHAAGAGAGREPRRSERADRRDDHAADPDGRLDAAAARQRNVHRICGRACSRADRDWVVRLARVRGFAAHEGDRHTDDARRRARPHCRIDCPRRADRDSRRRSGRSRARRRGRAARHTPAVRFGAIRLAVLRRGSDSGHRRGTRRVSGAGAASGGGRAARRAPVRLRLENAIENLEFGIQNS
jgi:predicted permease